MATQEKTAKPGAQAPADPQETKMGPQQGGGVDLEQVLAVVLEQNTRLAALIERREAETSEREAAAAEAAAQQKLPPSEDEVEEGFEAVVFRSKGDAFRVVRVGRHRYAAANGETQETEGRAYQFRHSAMGLSELVVRNSNVAEFLRGRPSFNREFWEVGAEPHAAPDPKVVLDQVIDATIELDDERLEELLEREMASHQRPVVLDSIRAARRKIRGKVEAG